MSNLSDLFNPIHEEIDLPQKFTFPFLYTPHPLAALAAEELQYHLKTQTNWSHDFGLDESTGKGMGKMFGVLVVRNTAGELGYLSAYSGKMSESNHLPGFVPPVFDILKQDGFYKIENLEVDELNDLVFAAENNPALHETKLEFESSEKEKKETVESIQAKIRENRKTRKISRAELNERLSGEELELELKEITRQSIKEQYFLKDTQRDLKLKVENAKDKYFALKNELLNLRKKRSKRSATLQRKIFDHYTFLNANKESKSLMEIFSFLDPGFPPAGSGECAAPKLMHYAFANNLEPICMAEFWWGKSLSSQIRKHKHFYPACKSKCEPILGHMLEGLDVDENPILKDPSFTKEIKIVFEDEALLVINKPYGFLSVPGKLLTDSVQERVENMFPENQKPILVHRLDMATSGLLLVAKTKEAHKELQSRFIQRTIKKRYVALLDGILEKDSGIVDLPIRLDLDNRPHQLVCEEFGKKSRTEFKVISRDNNQTRLHFFPITGRTHQLRVHASHPLGLNIPIVGDNLYGKQSDRLYLHAEWLRFKHPITQEEVEFEVKAEF